MSTRTEGQEQPDVCWWRSAGIDWAQAEPKQALRVFSTAWTDKDELVFLAERAGISRADIDRDGAPRQVWRRLLELAARSGLLGRLIQEALDDSTRAAHRPQLEALLDGDLGVEIAAARLAKGPSDKDESTLVRLGASLESVDGADSSEGLQAIVSAGAGLGDPLAYISAIANAMRRTAMIEIGGRPVGTGFLVGERHLLTNAHVVGATTAPPAADLKVCAVFDFYAGELASHAEHGRRVMGRVVAHSLPTTLEIRGQSSDWNAPATNLDYALVELDAPVARQPGGPATLAELGAGSPRGHFQMATLKYNFGGATFLLVTQHPLGEHLVMSRAVRPFTVNGEGTRVRYKANTLPGSSGSSVLDERGRLVALHHYGRRGTNQGVPISVVAEDLRDDFPGLFAERKIAESAPAAKTPASELRIDPSDIALKGDRERSTPASDFAALNRCRYAIQLEDHVMEPKPQAALDLLFSYSHKDEALRDQLETHLSPLKRRGLIRTWHDRKIGAGREWAGQIDDHLETAHIILLLVSPDFTASDYCWDVEVKRALERHEAGQARVIPVVLRPVDWHDTPFAKLQALPKDAKPVVSWSNPDEAFMDVAKAIRRTIEDETERRTQERPTPASDYAALKSLHDGISGGVAGASGEAPKARSQDAASPRAPEPKRAGGRALALWQKKLDLFLEAEAIATGADEKFRLGEQIEEARQKIRELGG